MTVYVDDARNRCGRMLMCHMIADRTDELLVMADRIGVARRHLQHAGTVREHCDICVAKRRLAVAAGAVEIARRALVAKLRAKADADPKEATS